jgi:hypothetical protein
MAYVHAVMHRELMLQCNLLQNLKMRVASGMDEDWIVEAQLDSRPASKPWGLILPPSFWTLAIRDVAPARSEQDAVGQRDAA